LLSHSAASSLLFLLLPDVEQNHTSPPESLGKEAAKVLEIIKSPKHRNLIFYYFFPGLCVGFYATFLYKLIGLSLPD
jgi:hypothetical protein